MASNRDWGVASASLTQPPFAGPNDPSIVIFPDPIPQAVINEVHATLGATWNVDACILYKRTDTLYWFECIAHPTSPSTFGDLAIVRGAIQSTIGATGQIWSYSSILGGNRHRLGTDVLDLDIQIGDTSNAGIKITKNPFTIPAVVTIGAGIGGGTSGTINLEAGTGVGVINLTALGGTNVTGPHLIAPQSVGQEVEIQDIGGTPISVPRGSRSSNQSTGNSGAIGTTETAVITITNFVWRANRAYRVEFGPAITASLTTNVGQFRLRKTNATGTLWGDAAAFGPSGAPPNIAASGCFYVRRNTGSDLTATVVLTLQASSAGTVTQIGQAAAQRYLSIVDCGHTADFPFAFAVT